MSMQSHTGKALVERLWTHTIFAGLEPNGEIAVSIAQLKYGRPRPGFLVPSVELQIESLKPPDNFTWIEAHGISDVAEPYYSSRKVNADSRAEYERIRSELGKDPPAARDSVPAKQRKGIRQLRRSSKRQ